MAERRKSDHMMDVNQWNHYGYLDASLELSCTVHPEKGTGIFGTGIFWVTAKTGNNPCAHQLQNKLYLWLSTSVNLKNTILDKEACSGGIYVYIV